MAALALLAFLGGALGLSVPHASAAPSCVGMSASVALHDCSPAKAPPLGCVAAAPCILGGVLLPTSAALPIAFDWTLARYWSPPRAMQGIAVEPDLSPPIRRS